jgi:hypothetical protein
MHRSYLVREVIGSQRTANNQSIEMSGGAGEIRTPDKQFRKLLLYPSELQPHISIVILPGLFSSACVCQGDDRVAPGAEAGGSGFNPGAIFVMRRLRKIVGQYSRSALLAVFRPIRNP